MAAGVFQQLPLRSGGALGSVGFLRAPWGACRLPSSCGVAGVGPLCCPRPPPDDDEAMVRGVSGDGQNSGVVESWSGSFRSGGAEGQAETILGAFGSSGGVKERDPAAAAVPGGYRGCTGAVRNGV